MAIAVLFALSLISQVRGSDSCTSSNHDECSPDDDSQALLQLSMSAPASKSTEYSERQENCKCLNWKKVYNEHLATCGDALETYSWTKKVGQHLNTGHFCEGAAVYSNRNDDYCTKVWQGGILPRQPDNWTYGTWCYVPSSCADINGGARVNQKVSWKSCRQGQDAQLGDLNPNEISKMAVDNKMDVGLLIQMAYPVMKEITFHQARAQLRSDSNIDDPAGSAALQAVIKSKKPTILCQKMVPPEIASFDPCGVDEEQLDSWVIVGNTFWSADYQACKVGGPGCDLLSYNFPNKSSDSA